MEIKTPSQLILVSAAVGSFSVGMFMFGVTRGNLDAVWMGMGIGALIGEWPLLFLSRQAQPVTERRYESTFRASILSEDGSRGTFAHFPASKEQMERLARGLVLERRKFTFDVWTAGRNKTFERHEFAAIQDEMVRRNLARWRSDTTTQRGVVLTSAGEAWLYYLATGRSPHHLPGGDGSQLA